MTSNIFMSNLLRKGKQVLQGILKSKTQNVGVKVVQKSQPINSAQPVLRFQSALPRSRINYIWKGILPKFYCRSLARDLGQRAAWQRARNLPLFAFAGFVIAQHANEEDNEIADRIQDFVKKVDTISSPLLQRVQELSLDNFEFGQLSDEQHDIDLEADIIDSDKESDIASKASMQDFADSDNDSDVAVLDQPDEEEISDPDRAPFDFQVDDDSESKITVLSHPDEDDDYDVSSKQTEREEQVGLEETVEDSNNSCLGQVESDATDSVENEQMYDSLDSSYSDEQHDIDLEADIIDSDKESDIASKASMQDFADSDNDSDVAVLDQPDEEEISDRGRAPFDFQVDDDSESDITVLSHPDEDDDYETAPLIFYVDDDRSNDFNDDEDSDSDFSLLSWSDLEDELEKHPSELIPATDDVSSKQTEREEQVDLEETVEDSNNSCLGQVESDATDSVENDQMYDSLDSSYSEVSDKYNLAVKMMFNYDVESNADAILREMDRETVPARLVHSQGQMLHWQNGKKVRKKCLPPHTNIVEMLGVFVDPVPHLPDSLLNYPAPLPARINPNGIGRNMTMFLAMKKYQYTLGEYLSTFNPSFRERLFLLGQLLEGVAHMRRHGIAHRDLKLNNIFLDTTTGVFPQLVVGDFGCCLADDIHGMQIPYQTEGVDRGGNTALMAPEISTAEPGRFQYLDYRKADLWATAALAYEILGEDNPFYTNKNGERLDSRTYKMSELPPLSNSVPQPVKSLVYSMLEREPNKRPSARVAADIVHVLLWAPSDWLLPGKSVSKSEVTWWLVTMATEVLLGTKSPERMLKRNFIQNFNMNNLKCTLNFLDIKM